MNATADRHRRLSDAVSAKIERVPADRWEGPSPCAGWTTRDVVRHLVDTHGMFVGFIGETPAAGPEVADDPLGAWTTARVQMQSLLDDPERAQQEFEGASGRQTFAAAVDRFICFDLNIHGWDIARAAGLDETIAADEIPRIRETAESFGPALRSDRVCGPELEVGPDADEQAKLLAFLGRQP